VGLITLATELLLLLHVPPLSASLNVIVVPAHTRSKPPIAGGDELTVTTAERLQPNPKEYVITDVPE